LTGRVAVVTGGAGLFGRQIVEALAGARTFMASRHLDKLRAQVKVYDVDAVVRVPRGSYSDLIYPLEMDVAGIMVPHVMSLDAPAASRRSRNWREATG
jgi:NAD(P)-dependent dehydrogenase (short-subunit alcohol dehydrogenase family)